MTDFDARLKADRGGRAQAIHLVDKAGFADWAKRQTKAVRALLEAARFDGSTGYQFALLPDGDGEFAVVAAVADTNALSPWCLARLGQALPAGTYRLAKGDPGPAALGWLLAQHRFDRYKKDPKPDPGPRVLLTANAASIDRTVRLATACAMVRDLVDTPAADMGPADLEAAARSLAKAHGASIEVIDGEALERGFPLIHAVGKGAERSRSPRLIRVEWGAAKAPLLTLVGKGVCFDSGGLDIKSAGGMRMMKKDMGGAAHALALAGAIMAAGIRCRLQLLIPAVENMISGSAFRPGDVIRSRSGIHVEVDNTDAEGRLVLADALTLAGEDRAPDLLIDFATLTGAARVALGPDLPATFVNEDPLAEALIACATGEQDPLWRMPLWDGYADMLKSDLADIANSADSPMAGAITAALFLKRFVPANTPWAHIDTFAWRPSAKPGRPKGGEALGLRAAYSLIEQRYGR